VLQNRKCLLEGVTEGLLIYPKTGGILTQLESSIASQEEAISHIVSYETKAYGEIM